MLFSLVLSVASKEVELWQAFDDFAPRRLMDAVEQFEEGDETDLDDEGGELMNGEDDVEEGGMGALKFALPVAGLAAAGGLYFFMNQGGKEEAREEEGKDTDLLKQLQDPKTQMAAAATALATGYGLYSMLSSGSSSGSIAESTKFWTPKTIAGTGVATIGGMGLLSTGFYQWKKSSLTQAVKNAETNLDNEKKKLSDEDKNLYKNTFLQLEGNGNRTEDEERTLKDLKCNKFKDIVKARSELSVAKMQLDKHMGMSHWQSMNPFWQSFRAKTEE